MLKGDEVAVCLQAGEVFPAMHNFKRGHRATSIGTQLLTNYRKYLAAYEKAWADVDLATYAGRPLIQVHIVLPSLSLVSYGLRPLPGFQTMIWRSN